MPASTRQKSFFDQNPKSKHVRCQWHPRQLPPGPRVNSYDRPSTNPPTGPPIMPSTQTRTKLKKFQFVEGAPPVEPATKTVTAHVDKENACPPPDVSCKTGETPKPATTKVCPPPSTPSTRLPLAELVGNVDDSTRHMVDPVVSPEEQLCWRGSQLVNTPISRKRKRARSSSPAAPSQEESRNPESAKKDFTTPQADPSVDLLNRYTNNKGTPSGAKVVAFAHLISESSPRSSASVGSVSGLRRWASCGIQFPVSAKKKRRIHATLAVARDPVGDDFQQPSSDGVFHAQPLGRRSLADMLSNMRESIRQEQPKITSHVPSSSSPLPEPERLHRPCDSPLRGRSREHILNVETSETLQGERTDADANTGREQNSSSSDDFGDFDDEMVDALEISVDAPGAPNRPDGSPAPSPSVPIVSAPVETNLHPAIGGDNDDNEFDLDEDIFAADLEQVASLYDTRPLLSPSAQAVQASTETATAAGAPVIDLVDDDDDFGDDIGADEFAAAEVAATQAPMATSEKDSRAIQRYLIKRVDEGSYASERGYQLPEKVLLVEDEKTKLFKAINLRQAWFDTPCTAGSFVHVIGEFANNGQCIIDDHSNMLILHPDHLISATVVADSFTCLRRAVLQDRIKATSRANPAMLYGTLLHELFQQAIKVNRWDTGFLLETIDSLLPGKFETILEVESTCEEVKEHLSSKLPELQSWAELFVRAEPRPDAIVRERNGRQATMSINKLLDVEEHVWSPMYGLKGNIDATVQVTMKDDLGERNLTVPFEIKTGRNTSNSAHIAQTALYNLLLSDRYDIDVAYGILYYLETSDTSRISAIRNDIIHMIIKRNELACYVRDRIELPPMLKEDHKCQKCYAQEACFLYNTLVEDGHGESLNKKAKERYDELIQSLKPSHQEFMKKWDSLLTKEESDMMKFRRELWTMLSTEREKLGRCFSNVILEPGSAHEDKNGGKINRYTYTFIKPRSKPGFSFTESQLIVGEPVVVSDESGHFALANGYVTNVRKHRITVAVDRRLHNSRTKQPGFDSQTNQRFTGIMEVGKEGEPILQPQDDEEPTLYRLDKDEFSNGMAAARNNLIQIMDDNVYKARDLRALIVDGRAPVFNSAPNATSLSESSQMSMNADQKAAVSKVMSAKDYALVLGMPGTGKTTTIAHIIRALVAKGKSVLLTSYTHTAVDNILLKIRDDNIGILRLGAAAKVHPEVREFAMLGAEPKDSLEELEKSWMEPPVVATTCLSISHPLFNRRVFDYCIVDEASQITLPVCLGPIRLSQRFILVGDHYQLPPLVQNKEAAEGGLDVSLFKLLCEAHPEAVTSLEHQYRMCADIMHLSNTFIYSGRLKCGTPTVASRRLHLPNPNGLAAHHLRPQPSRPLPPSICPDPASPTCWLARTLTPSSPVVFINTDPCSTHLETQSGPRINNTLEARLVTHLTLSLLALGVPASEIGVIAFYRSQLALLRASLSAAHTQTQSTELAGPALPSAAAAAAVELHTADKFQGRDKEVVLVSCVRSNDNGVVGDLLKDRRRVNVALTRARSKLVLLGSEKTLANNELLRDIVALCRANGWVLDLEMQMVEGHAFDEGVVTQASSAAAALPPPNPTCSPPAKAKSGAKGPVANGTVTKSPRAKRSPLGDITMEGGLLNARAAAGSPDARSGGKTGRSKMPGKVCMAGRRGVLAGRSVLENVFYEAV